MRTNHGAIKKKQTNTKPTGKSCYLYIELPPHGVPKSWLELKESFEGLQGEDSPTSLHNLFQGSVTCMAQMCFLVFRRSLLCSRLCPAPLVLVLSTSDRSLGMPKGSCNNPALRGCSPAGFAVVGISHRPSLRKHLPCSEQAP